MESSVRSSATVPARMWRQDQRIPASPMMTFELVRRCYAGNRSAHGPRSRPQPRDRSGQATLQRKSRARPYRRRWRHCSAIRSLRKEHDALRPPRLPGSASQAQYHIRCPTPMERIVEIGGTYPQEERRSMTIALACTMIGTSGRPPPVIGIWTCRRCFMVSLAQHGQQPPLVHAHGRVCLGSSRTARGGRINTNDLYMSGI